MSGRVFHFRAFFSFLTLFGFISAVLTGVVLFMTPEGRIAYWTGWTFLGLSKDTWGCVHIVSSLLFLLAGVFHTVYNGRVLVGYIKKKGAKGLRMKRELAAASALLLLALAGGILELPPVDRLMVFNERLKDSWIGSPEHEPPFGHAEQVSLLVLTRRQGIDLDQALKELDTNNIRVEDPGDSLEDIAAKNGIDPIDIYRVIKPLETGQRQKKSGRSVFMPGAVERRYAESGIGGKILDELCLETGTELEAARQRLSSRGIAMEDDETVRQPGAVISSPWISPRIVLTGQDGI